MFAKIEFIAPPAGSWQSSWPQNGFKICRMVPKMAPKTSQNSLPRPQNGPEDPKIALKVPKIAETP